MDLHTFINNIPKAELHVHIEGTFEPKLMFAIAKRNKIKTKYSSISQVKKAYQFSNLQDFLDVYYNSARVLTTEKDFYDLTITYLKKAQSQNIVHAEIFFDPQTHTERGIPFSVVINGIHKALVTGKKIGISTKLIMCFLRHLSQQKAEETLQQALPYKKWITAVGLDSSEKGHPPSQFQQVFKKARQTGFLTVAHAGEEGSAAYVKQALELLHVSRIDHGNHCLDNKNITQNLIHQKIPLTICPLSNLKLNVVPYLKNHPLKKMMKKGLLVSINSDDPAYFGGYINENYYAIAQALHLSKQDIIILAKNSITSSFLSEREKKQLYKQINLYSQHFL
ncbi:MAG: adenosine deaminase [Candidatus Woesearchaeota archaeon]|jgi:adenosine deaminase